MPEALRVVSQDSARERLRAGTNCQWLIMLLAWGTSTTLTDAPLSCIMSAAKCAQVLVRLTVTRTEEPTESRRTFKVPSLPPRPEGTSEDHPPVRLH
jgi:hypothetical protein